MAQWFRPGPIIKGQIVFGKLFQENLVFDYKMIDIGPSSYI